MRQTITIVDGKLSLAIALPNEGMPEILAFGPGAETAHWMVPRANRENGMDIDTPSATLLATAGLGYFGWPAIAGHRDGRASVTEFSDWRVEGGGAACSLHARDLVTCLALTIELRVAERALSVTTCLSNEGVDVYTLERCMAGSMLVPEGPAGLTRFSGMWGREFQIRQEPLTAGLWMQENRRGRTSHDRSPSVILTTAAGVLAAHLGWSGNHLVAIETLDDGRRLIHLGELFEPGEIRLAPGEAYRSPTAYFALDVAALRARISSEMTWPMGALTPRPVTLNTWEGVYFDHRLPQLKAQATAAANLGIERFVLDDGWFGNRDSDASSLGDWTIDPRKYPDGLKPLADHVHELGMQFGLWFEPEMVSPDSDLYRAHPEWVLAVEGRRAPLSRKQLVLDLTQREAADHIFVAMNAVLRATPVDYIKWDMNRDLAPGADASGKARTAAQTRAVYALIDRIRAAHPQLEIETCASGGGRADYGALQHAHRIWTSDCTDPLARLEIQRGARLFFPPHILGAHISASPNHQTHRETSLDFRALVAFAYHLGVELDPLRLDDDARMRLKAWIALHKRFRPILHGDQAFHLEPWDGRYVWGAASPDTLLLVVAQGAQMMSEQAPPLRVPAEYVTPGVWRIETCFPSNPDFARAIEPQHRLLQGEVAFSAASLTGAGLPLPMLRPLSGFVLELKRMNWEQALG